MVMRVFFLLVLGCRVEKAGDTGDLEDDAYGSGESGSGSGSGTGGGGETGGETGGGTGGTGGLTERTPFEFDLSESHALLIGEDVDHQAAWHIAGGGDVDGDGVPDIVVGAPGASAAGASTGAVYVVTGPVSGRISLADAWYAADGERRNDWAGSWVALTADTDGDGLNDVLVGAPGDRTYVSDPAAGSGPGVAYLLSGLTSGSSDLGSTGLGDADLGSATATFAGEEDTDRAGSAVDGAGDIDGDGLEDIVVGISGATGQADNSGKASVFLAPFEGRLVGGDAAWVGLGEREWEQAGSGVAGAGDVDGDGYADLAIGADADDKELAGRVYILRGPLGSGTSALQDTADAVLDGEHVNDAAGSSLFGKHDVDGDGRSDLWINAYESETAFEEAGVGYLLYGPMSGALSLADSDVLVHGREGDKHAGESIGYAGDVDGDGFGDLLMGGHELGDSSGQALLFYGPLTADTTIDQAHGTFTSDDLQTGNTGWSVAGAGDLDGDGTGDLLIGDNQLWDSTSSQGGVHVVLARQFLGG